MKLNHDIYREAMGNVRISDETGQMLLREAAQKNAQDKKKWKKQLAAAAALILMVSIGANGICYAQTGKNVVEMFAGIFGNVNAQDIPDSLAALAGAAKECGQSITDGNLKFTLEYYIYDKDNTEAFLAIRTDSLDGTPLDMDSILYNYSFMMDCSNSMTWSEPSYNEGKTTAWVYYHSIEMENAQGNSPEKLDIPVEKIGAYLEDGMYDTETIGCFSGLEPAGQLKTRYVDCSFLEYCDTKATITGGKFSLVFNKNLQDVAFTLDAPLHFIEIEMRNGHVYRIGNEKNFRLKGKMPIYNTKGKLLNAEDFTEEELEFLGNQTSASEGIDSSGNIHTVYGEGFRCDAGRSTYSAHFDDFLDVDEITAVYIDEIKMPLE